VRATIKYTVIRIGIFAVVLAALLLISTPWYFATPIAAIAGLAVSYIFFRKVRDQMAIELATRGKRNARDEVIPDDDDTAAEDAAIDRLNDQRESEN
jgi:hypothetical protein